MPSTFEDIAHATASADHLSKQHSHQPFDVEAIALAYLAGMKRINANGVTGPPLVGRSSSAAAATNARGQSEDNIFAESFADDKVIAQTIVKGRGGGQTVREALEALHGVKNRSAQWWKDYYMEYSESINDLVARTAKYAQAASAPAPASLSAAVQGLEPFNVTTSAVISEPTLAKHHRDSHRRDIPAQRTEGSGTCDKLDVDDSVSGTGVPSMANEKLSASAPSLYLSLDIPSRPPTPPTKVEKTGPGNKFTEDDKEFFVKLILWELSRDSSLTRSKLMRLAAEKTPHHPYGSWTKFCSKGEPRLQLDYVLAAAQAGKLRRTRSTVPHQIKVEGSEHPRSTEDRKPPVSEKDKKPAPRSFAPQPMGSSGQAGSMAWKDQKMEIHPQTRTWQASKSTYVIAPHKGMNALPKPSTRSSQYGPNIGGPKATSSKSRLSSEVIDISTDEEDVVLEVKKRRRTRK
ncbi:hypothetical protein A0H81_03083 [Grifola frondosa]|uniref:Uncharacterized protein n=1 Tax=Grifola frondosa TaxID=5627 RepID=A0A1C7MGJ0_GRIFR|nr:hypothetical protein A0H81_03083 [Grifola frondosa]